MGQRHQIRFPTSALALLLFLVSFLTHAEAAPAYQALQFGTNLALVKEFPKTEPSVSGWMYNFPRGPLVVLATSGGGPLGQGRLLRIPPAGTPMEDIMFFTNATLVGSEPQGPFNEAIADLPGLGTGIMFGVCRRGGAADLGCIVRVRTDGGYTVMRSFTASSSDGRYPNGGLTFVQGYLYGTTPEGGLNNSGTLFRIKYDGTDYSVLKHFGDSLEGARTPNGSMVFVEDSLYGTTYAGGVDDLGTLFRYKVATGVFSVRWNFGSAPHHGILPAGGLTATRDFGSGDAFYGLASYGGTNDAGTLYRFDDYNQGTFTAIRHFGATSTDPRYPRGRVAISGNLGVRYVGVSTQGGEFGKGAIFAVGSDPEVLHSFKGGEDDGELPLAGPVICEGVAMGVASKGGRDEAGILYKVGLGYEVPLSWANTSLAGSTARFQLQGEPQVRYTIESRPAGNLASWTKAGSIQTDNFGMAMWTNTVSGSTGTTGRFFRFVWP